MNRNIENNFFECIRPDLCLVLAKCGDPMTFFGVFDLQVLYGCLNVRGYKFVAGGYDEDRFVSVSAPFVLGPPINLEAFSSGDSIINQHRLKWRIKKISPAADKILNIFREGDALVLLRFSVSNAVACTRDIYESIFFIPPVTSTCIILDAFCCALTKRWPVNYPYTTLTSIVSSIKEDTTTMIMVTGGKGVGKSTISRLLANLLLSKEKSVYILDGDVGQSERNPPGCVSLFHVDGPLLGVPHLHQKSSLLTYFYGNISPEDDSDSYLLLLLKLIDYFKSIAPAGSVLVFNTLGWVEGDGIDVLNSLIEKISPHFVVNIESENASNYPTEVAIKKGSVVHIIESYKKASQQLSVPFNLSAASLRDLLILGYMSAVSPSPSISAFAMAIPYAVNFNSIAINFHPQLCGVPDTHIFAVLNCTLIALCISDDEASQNQIVKRRLLNREDMPWLLKSSLTLRLIGFGFIRGIDIDKRFFYVITPVDRSDLVKVNTFARGLNIEMPHQFLAKQRTDKAPYLMQSKWSSLNDELYKGLTIGGTFSYKRPRLHH